MHQEPTSPQSRSVLKRSTEEVEPTGAATTNPSPSFYLPGKDTEFVHVHEDVYYSILDDFLDWLKEERIKLCHGEYGNLHEYPQDKAWIIDRYMEDLIFD